MVSIPAIYGDIILFGIVIDSIDIIIFPLLKYYNIYYIDSILDVIWLWVCHIWNFANRESDGIFHGVVETSGTSQAGRLAKGFGEDRAFFLTGQQAFGT